MPKIKDKRTGKYLWLFWSSICSNTPFSCSSLTLESGEKNWGKNEVNGKFWNKMIAAQNDSNFSCHIKNNNIKMKKFIINLFVAVPDALR